MGETPVRTEADTFVGTIVTKLGDLVVATLSPLRIGSK